MANFTWKYRLLRYVPNVVSGEFYNLAVMLYDPTDNLVDARFAEDFSRVGCHPLADVSLLEQLRREFEDRQLLGEGFSEYVAGLDKYLSKSFDFSETRAVMGGSAAEEIERLYRQLVASPPRLEAERGIVAPRPGTRRYLRARIDGAFEQQGLFLLGVERDREVRLGADRALVTFDYAYQPNGRTEYIHAVALENGIEETMRLGFLKTRIGEAGLRAVVDDRTQDDVLGLLSESGIRPWTESRIDELAAEIRAEFGG